MELTTLLDLKKSVFSLIKEERQRQNGKFGNPPVNSPRRTWITVIQEEIGEVSRAEIDQKPDQYVSELIQVAACIIYDLTDFEQGSSALVLEARFSENELMELLDCWVLHEVHSCEWRSPRSWIIELGRCFGRLCEVAAQIEENEQSPVRTWEDKKLFVRNRYLDAGIEVAGTAILMILGVNMWDNYR